MRKKTNRKQDAELFPLFLKLHGRPCLVVGAGRVAEPKMESLLRCGARVRVIAPQATPGIRQAARSKAIRWEQRAFRSADLRGVFLVVAATSSPKLHQRIFRLARRAGILCNAVDEPGRCDFYYPAVVRRGPLQIAISTSGNAPALAGRLRQELQQELERRFPANYGIWVKQIGQVRARLLAGPARSQEARRALLLELSNDSAHHRFQRNARKRAARQSARSGA